MPQQQLVTDFQNSSSYDMAGTEFSGERQGGLACAVRATLCAEKLALRHAGLGCGCAALWWGTGRWLHCCLRMVCHGGRCSSGGYGRTRSNVDSLHSRSVRWTSHFCTGVAAAAASVESACIFVIIHVDGGALTFASAALGSQCMRKCRLSRRAMNLRRGKELVSRGCELGTYQPQQPRK